MKIELEVDQANMQVVLGYTQDIIEISTGIEGAQGEPGEAGATGAAGAGVPTGGTTNQALVKSSGVDLATAWHTLVKGDVGLGNVDNTADTAKPVSTAGQTALDLKANLASPTLTGTPAAPTAAANTNTTQIATTAYVQTELGALVKGDVGLGSVDNTADTAKPVSTAQQTALNLKANIANPTFTGTVTLAADPSSALHAATKQYVDSLAINVGKRARVRVATTVNITISTALNNGDVLEGVTLVTGDWVLVKNQTLTYQNGIYVVGAVPARVAEFDTYNEHAGSLIAVGEGTTQADTLWLCTSNDGGTLDTTAIAFSKMIIAGELLAANDLSDLASAATARTNLVLGNVDNTADTAKPVSTAQQTALNLKANLASPALTGTPTAPTAAADTNTTQVATTAYVQTELGALTKTDVGLSNVTNVAQMPSSYLDTDSTLAANSNTRVPSQQAIKAYVDLKSNIASPTFTGTPAAPTAAANTNTTQIATTAYVQAELTALVKGDVGLGNVDNTADTAKPVSTAQQTALNLKANLASPALTGTPTAPTAATTTSTTQLATTAFVQQEIAANPASIADGAITLAKLEDRAQGTVIGRAAGAGTGVPTARTDAQLKTDMAFVKADVGLGSADNTSDAGKPVSTAQQTALNLKANLASPTLTGTPAAPTAAANTNTTQIATTAYVQAELTALTASDVGLGSVDNTSDAGKPVSTAQQTALNLKANLASPTLTGTPLTPTAAANTNTTQIASTAYVQAEIAALTSSDVGLGNVDNTADTAKPVSTAQQTALNLKANLASPTLTGTPAAPTAAANTNTTQIATTAYVQAEIAALVSSDVGLGSVDNTSDAGKPVSTAQQTALNLKANLASPTLTGTPLTTTAAAGTATTQIASTAFVMNTAAFHAYRGTNQTGVTTATWTQFTPGSETHDIGALFASNKWTPPVGRCAVGARIEFHTTNVVAATLFTDATKYFQIAIYKNGTAFLYSPKIVITNTAFLATSIAGVDACNGTDYYELFVYMAGSSGNTQILSGAEASHFWGYQI